jgi:uncharacterized protein (DUF2164 family)
MNEIKSEKIEAFVKEVMKIERRYSTEQKNQKSNRISEIRDYLERFAAKELENED